MSKPVHRPGSGSPGYVAIIVRTYLDFLLWLLRPLFPFRELGKQFITVITSTFVTVLLGAVVQGMFIAWLEGYYGTWFGATVWVGAGAVQAVLLESSVLMTAILYACKAGTGFTVEISSMNMSGQIDALRLMDVEPVQYLVLPRVLSSVAIVPIFVGISHGIAIASTYVFLMWWFDIPLAIFLESAIRFTNPLLITRSLYRAAVIGLAVAMNSCALGFRHTHSAEDLGRTTTVSIVINIFTIFLIDLVMGVYFVLSGSLK